MNWKPMSEAPRDGRQIMGWVAKGSGFAINVRWDDSWQCWYAAESEWSDEDFTRWAPIEPPKEDE